MKSSSSVPLSPHIHRDPAPQTHHDDDGPEAEAASHVDFSCPSSSSSRPLNSSTSSSTCPTSALVKTGFSNIVLTLVHQRQQTECQVPSLNIQRVMSNPKTRSSI